jgi:hypothetical protein
MNFDLGFSIFDLLPRRPAHGRFATGNNDRGNLVGFVKQRLNTFGGQQPSLDDYLEPEATLIGFFFNDRGLVNKVRSRLGAAKRSIVCSNGSATADKLMGDGVSAASSRNRVDQLQDSQGKRFGSLFHLNFVHARF